MNLPAGYATPTSYEWADRSRITRIKEVLAATPKATIQDSMALQSDSRDALSRRAIALLAPLKSPDPAVQQALDMLRGWNNDEAVSSAPAAIYQVWATKHLGKTVVDATAPEKARALIGQGQLDAVISYLETPQAAAARDALLLKSLGDAVAELTTTLGPDMSTWNWGRLHHAEFIPSITVLADKRLARQMDLGALEVPGSASTPRATSYRPSDFTQVSGASVRVVMDVGQWDNSVAVNTPGQSGDPLSPHYRDLYPLWAAGSYVPLDFSRAAVDRDAEMVVSLTPAK
jgi:penicillin amidase